MASLVAPGPKQWFVVAVPLGVLLVLGSCGARSTWRSHARTDADCGAPIAGTSAQLTLVSGADGGPVFAAPITCETATNPGVYVAVSRAEGARTITFERRGVGECDVPDADPAQCPDVTIEALGHAVLDELRKELGPARADGFGLGACAEVSSPLSAWNLGSQIHDWADANRAIEITGATLARWNVRGEWGLSITAIPCVREELAASSE